jgi:hypothetical protein
MQRYSCQHCGLHSENTFDLFLHIFTQHMHKDVGLSTKEVVRLLSGSRPLDLAYWVFSSN